jgi:16S rRNA processing protein RimM
MTKAGSKKTSNQCFPDDVPLLPVGHLSKAHGIRGELLCIVTADSPGIISGELILKARGQDAGRRLVVERTRVHHNSLLVSFRGVNTRSEAELLCRHTLFVPRDRLPPLAADELYLADLPGLRVLVVEPGSACAKTADHAQQAAAPQQERDIGRILSVDVPAGQELWTILTPEGKEILFPAVEAFVLSIDLERRKAVICPPPGLLELYTAADGS